MSGLPPQWSLPPLLLLAGAAACGSPPRLGVEAVLARTGLLEGLLEQAKHELDGTPTLVVDESQRLLERLKAGELEVVLANDDLGSDALLREGAISSAKPLFYDEVVLVGPDTDPIGVHAERNLPNVLRALIETQAAFFRCGPCGTHAREEAMIAALPDLPQRGNSFMSVGKSEEDVIRALQSSPGYAFLARPTVIARLKSKEWSFKPVWSGDALQVDTYRLLVPPRERLDPARREKTVALVEWLTGDAAKRFIEKYGVAQVGQAYYKPGSAPVGEGVRF